MYYRTYNNRDKHYLEKTYNIKNKKKANEAILKYMNFFNLDIVFFNKSLTRPRELYKKTDFVIESSVEKFDEEVLLKQLEDLREYLKTMTLTKTSN